MNLNVENCNRCGKIFAKSIRDICPACIKEIDKQFQVCKEYLRKHREITINELSEETHVSVKQITQFIREGRISTKYAQNLTYPCDMCGEPIREHNMCDNCRNRLNKDIQTLDENEKKREDNHAQGQISYQIRDRLRNKDK